MSTKCETEILTLEHYLELKHEGYEFEGQSYLFWEYMRILKEVKPIYFLLENVMMGEKWERVLSRAIGVKPIEINSALVSAQSRKRLYWTNIGMEPRGLFGDLESIIPQPKDKGILLKDVLESDVDEKYYLSSLAVRRLLNEGKDGFKSKIKNGDEKAATVFAQQHKLSRGMDLIVASRGRNPENPSDRTTGANLEQRLEPRTDGKTNTLTSVQKDNMVIQLNPSKESGGVQPHQQNRVYSPDGISPALLADMSSGTHAVMESEHRIRRLTPTECEKLQTVPIGYTSMVSDTQRYLCLGNGWTVDVIAYIYAFISPPHHSAINSLIPGPGENEGYKDLNSAYAE